MHLDLSSAARRLRAREWQADWHNDAALAEAADIALRYDVRFEAYRRAFEAVGDPPPELLYHLARCHLAPGTPPISRQRAIALLERAVAGRHLADAAQLLASLLEAEGIAS